MNNDSLHDEVLKIAPPVGVSTLSVLGVPLSDMVYITTIQYGNKIRGLHYKKRPLFYYVIMLF